MPTQRSQSRRFADLCAASLIIAAGAAISAAQDQPAHIRIDRASQQSGNKIVQPEDPKEIQRKRNETRQQYLERLKEQQAAEQELLNNPGGVPGAETGSGATDGAAPLGAQLEQGEDPLLGSLEDLQASDTVSLNFRGDGIDLEAFVEYVRKALNTNIVIVGDGLAGRRVRFETSQRVPKDQLLNLLAGLVENQGFALITNDMGWYEITETSLIEPNAIGELATTKVIPTPLLRPSQVVQTASTQLGNAAQNLRISPIDDIGVLIVTGSPRTIAKLEAIIDQLRDSFDQVELRRIPLENVSADWAIQRLLQLNGILSQPIGPTTPGQGGGAQVAATAQLSDLASRMWPDHGNTLLFRGDEREYNRILELLPFVDDASSLEVKRYIVGKQVNDVAYAGQSQGLGNVETQQSTAGGFGGFGTQRTPGGTIRRGTGIQQQGSTGSIAGSRFIVDETTGSFLYFGTEAQHERVDRLVKQFTAQELEFKIIVETYKLQYAKAETIEEVLNSVLQDPTQRQPNSPFLPGANRTSTGGLLDLRNQLDSVIQGETGEAAPAADGSISATAESVNIVADTDRNQIIVRASARDQRDIERIIRLLDRRQPQVFIEVQIVSVTNSGTLDFTVEAEISPGRYILFSNFGLGDASTRDQIRDVPNSLSGVTSAIIDTDFVPLVVNALETESDTAIVSKPSMLVNDNYTATFSSLRSEPFSSTSQTNTGTITAQGGTAEAGTTLNVTPTITAGGSVKLEYSVELSDFDLAAQDSGSGLQPPTNSNNYESEVTVPGDSTIVVGGFSFQSERSAESKVPILGDIPIIGNLFKSINNTQSTNTIFVFITPRIIYENDDDKLMLLSEGPMAEMGIDPDIPALETVSMPIRRSQILRDRILPQNAPLPVPGKTEDDPTEVLSANTTPAE